MKKTQASAEVSETKPVDVPIKRSSDEGEATKIDTFKSKKRRKGQNKQRAKFADRREPPGDLLCKAILCQTTCSYGDSCKFSHNIKEFLSKKPEDIGEVCYNFTTRGRCPYGFACRYGKSHIKEENGEFVNTVDESLVSSSTSTSINGLNGGILTSLRKRQFDFSKATAATKHARELVDHIVKKNVELNCTKKSDRNEAISADTTRDTEPGDSIAVKNEANPPDIFQLKAKADVKVEPLQYSASGKKDLLESNAEDIASRPIGPVTNEDQFAIKPGEKKMVDFQNKLYLAPLTTVSIHIQIRHLLW